MTVAQILELIEAMHAEEHDKWAAWFTDCSFSRAERMEHFAKLSILEELLRRIDELLSKEN